MVLSPLHPIYDNKVMRGAIAVGNSAPEDTVFMGRIIDDVDDAPLPVPPPDD
jgi:hypothetical protein